MFERFRQLWICDFEYHKPDGEIANPVCLTAREFHTGQTIQLWRDELQKLDRAPFDTGADCAFSSYSAVGDLGCFLSLGWPLPTNVIDPYVEVLRLYNPEKPLGGFTLENVARIFKVATVDSERKRQMRELCKCNGPFTHDDQREVLAYCQNDSDVCCALLKILEPQLDHIDRVGFRGRYIRSVARQEFYGIPVDTELIERLRVNWPRVLRELIDKVDLSFGIFDGGHFRYDRFEAMVARRGISWPTYPSGQLNTSDVVFRDQALLYPELEPLRQVVHTYRSVRPYAIPIGQDGRNRCFVYPFGQKTGRNNHKPSEFVLAGPTWARSLIRPQQGKALAYLDFQAEEFGVAAALSQSPAMKTAYESGEPYLYVGELAGVISPDNSPDQRKAARERLKALSHGINYGEGPARLADNLGVSRHEARVLIATCNQIFEPYAAWADAARDHGLIRGFMETKFGWRRRVISNDRNPRSLRNFPVQGNAAEILRLSSCLCTESGLKVLGTLHDALLVEAEADQLGQVVAKATGLMMAAAWAVLDGFPIRVQEKCYAFPKRYQDERGVPMWNQVMAILGEVESQPGSESRVELEGYAG